MDALKVIGLAIVLGMMCAAAIVAALVCGAENWFPPKRGPHPWMKDKDGR